jgi:Kef-type K+ transport system membrane component KefB
LSWHAVLQALSCAAIDDVLAWCVLALASSFAKSGSALLGLYTTLLAAAYVFFMMVIVKPILSVTHRWLAAKGMTENRYYLSCLLLLMLASAFTTEGLGIHCFFGGFVAGLVMPTEGNFAGKLAVRMELVVSE